ncbi:hypothetical protein SDC9_117359 [bioreactor metagenome]|uniref:Uncharacterized protein n=1 Tax=bioreactor metagenome TaxID=1076179 RepID=A0A645C887_9ZZZZ
MAFGLYEVYGAAGDKVGRAHKVGQEKEPRERHPGAEDGITQIFKTGPPGFKGPVVEHQRHGNERHEFKEHIKGHKVICHGNAHKNSHRHGIEAQKLRFPLRVLQIGEGIDGYGRPDAGNQHHKKPGKTVILQGQP